MHQPVLPEDYLCTAKSACIIMAGGQGTRLGFSGPKGLFPLVRGKTLFQILVERAAKDGISVAVMTSTDNDAATRAHFASHANFGCKDLHFFVQKNLPCKGEDDLPPILVPCGNGLTLWDLAASGILAAWDAAGIQHIRIINIDNPLARPYAPEVLGVHVRCKADVTLDCIDREELSYPVGLFVKKESGVAIAEYSELSKEEQQARSPDGHYVHRLGNPGAYTFSVDFARRLTASEPNLPVHTARKKMAGRIILKPEFFIFDCLGEAKRVELVLQSVAATFAPLKEAEGPAGVLAVQKAYLAKESV